ncbi:MAG: mRNA interferase RelE/StbE [Limisphaerales bacterium]|jgi:mRNA interferase RelE/StbE
MAGAATRVYSPAFDRRFSALPEKIKRRLESALHEMGLKLEEFPHERMKGSRNCRLRVGEYRVIYQVDIDENTVFLLTVGHRRDIYRDPS